MRTPLIAVLNGPNTNPPSLRQPHRCAWTALDGVPPDTAVTPMAAFPTEQRA
ncbi:MAG: hypothetical protein JO209_07125 [Acidisphaera sp.]|nr:hypothetical protein [Acidisphaera sp.]